MLLNKYFYFKFKFYDPIYIQTTRRTQPVIKRGSKTGLELNSQINLIKLMLMMLMSISFK